MMHTTRYWQIADAGDPMALAQKLTSMTRCGCNGFLLEGYLFLNDATHEDGAQEYGVVKQDTGVQVESITFSWMKLWPAARLIEQVIDGRFDTENYGRVEPHQLQTPEQHGLCRFCA